VHVAHAQFKSASLTAVGIVDGLEVIDENSLANRKKHQNENINA
jgi:hypothetical protein